MRKLTFVFLIAMASLVHAQTLPSQWEVSLPGKVKWIQVNDWGILITACENGLYGIDPRDGSKIWEVPSLTNIAEENYNTIPETPLVLIADKGGDAKTMIINGLTGVIVFDSEGEGIEKVVSRKVIPEVGGVLIAYSNAGGDGVALFSYQDGQKKWDAPLEKVKGKTLQAQPIVDEAGNILYANGAKVYRFNGQTGEVVWQAEISKNCIDLFTSPDGTNVYAVSGNPSDSFRAGNAEPSAVTMSGGLSKFQIESFVVSTGEPLWKKPVVYPKSKYGGVALGESDFFLMHTLGANKIDYVSGAPVWKKERFGSGGAEIGGIFETDLGLIYVAPDGTGKTYVNYVNDGGEHLWKKRPVIMGQLIMVEDYGDAIFYITTRGANFISKEDGKLTWEGDKYLAAGDVPVSFIKDGDGTYVMYVRGMLIRIVPEERDWVEITSDFAFQAELPTGLQQIDQGYVLTGNQNAMLIDGSGSIVYHKYLEAPEQSFAAKLALGALSTASAVGSFAYGVSSLSYGLVGAVQENEGFMRKAEQQATVSMFTGELSGGFAAMAKLRFGEQASTNDYKLILTKQDKNIGFVKVGLADGTEAGMVVTDDRTPKFVVDGVDDRLFLKSGDTRVTCYEL